MISEEEIDAWYDEEKNKLMEELLARMANKEDKDAVEAEYRKKLQKLRTKFEKKRLANIAYMKKHPPTKEGANKKSYKDLLQEKIKGILGKIKK